MKEYHLLSGLMLGCFNRERQDQFDKKMRAKLKKYEEGYSKIQKLLETLHKDKESWETNLATTYTKAKEINSKEKSTPKRSP